MLKTNGPGKHGRIEYTLCHTKIYCNTTLVQYSKINEYNGGLIADSDVYQTIFLTTFSLISVITCSSVVILSRNPENILFTPDPDSH